MNDSRISIAEVAQPLTPADCDLRDFAFMPLDVVRLRDSDLAVTAEADEFRCAVLLWCASWHQVPAASLPDDDKILAQYAGYGRVVKEWMKVRDGALRGWVKCADGRLYHAVVAEKANEAWLAKLRQRLKTECARIKKHNERHKTNIPFPEFDAWMDAGCPVGQPLFVPIDKPPVSQGQFDSVSSENSSKGQGEGQGKLTSNSESSSQASTEVGAGFRDDDPMGKQGRSNEIAAVLRANGVLATSEHQVVSNVWASNSKVTDEVLVTAIARARKKKPNEDIPLKYLERTVETILAEQEVPPSDPRAPMLTGQPARIRKPYGLEPKGTDENYEEYTARIAAAEAEQRKRMAP